MSLETLTILIAVGVAGLFSFLWQLAKTINEASVAARRALTRIEAHLNWLPEILKLHEDFRRRQEALERAHAKKWDAAAELSGDAYAAETAKIDNELDNRLADIEKRFDAELLEIRAQIREVGEQV